LEPRRTDRRRPWFVRGLTLAIAFAGLGSRVAHAQDVEVPILVVETNEPGEVTESDDELDLANLVTSAAKGVTTVQEAPAIITIIPAEELRDGQAHMLTDVIDAIPGFMRLNSFYGCFPQAVSRGLVQAVLPLHDGFSMFDPLFNTMTVHQAVPVETIKRIETISGPGGVLWGANGFMGVVNVITKDAEDIDGVQANFSYGDGRGDATHYRGYVLAGIPGLFGHEDWGLVAHVSYENYKGTIYDRSPHMFSTPLPNPNSLYIYGPITESDPKRSTIINFDGKLALGKLTLQWSVPYVHRYQSGGFNGPLAIQDYPEDHLPQCSLVSPNDPDVQNGCADRARVTRESSPNFFERYGLAEYKTRFSEGAGLSIKGYFIQFVRDFDPILVLMPVPGLLDGGLIFKVDSTGYRTGSSIDGDVELGSKMRLLYGAEGFYEWLPDSTTPGGSRQGAGPEVHFYGPYDEGRLPLPCPRTGTWNPATNSVTDGGPIDGCPLTFSFEVGRLTLGSFASLQLRASQKLTLDGGVRLQASPEVFAHSRGYGLTPTVSAAAVYELVPDWHVKLNYAEGFRPPVLNATESNGEAVQLGGTPALQVETTRAAQFEINARLLKGRKRIRELDLRADYSYTVLENYIAFVGGANANTGDRGIHSAEFLGKLYLRGGHRLELGYSFNSIQMADKGDFMSVPNNWFTLKLINSLVADKLSLATVLHIYGAFEDSNRRVEARGLVRDPITGQAHAGNPMETVSVGATETVIDRAAPAAELQVGLLWTPLEQLELQGTLYNAFDSNRTSYDSFNDLEPRLEITPQQFEEFRFFLSGKYTF
jgi:outer membrane receptor protein involved in Fe transport